MKDNSGNWKQHIIWTGDDYYSFNIEFNGFNKIYLWKNHSWIDLGKFLDNSYDK
jgi:hypothetical protein